MTAKYRLLALDMDGTLLNEKHQITPRTVEAIHRAVDAGVHVCLSTGRSFRGAIDYAEQLGLKTPMITVNGSEIWRAPYELYRRSLMDPALIKSMLAIAERHGIWFWAYTTEQVLNRENWDGTVGSQEWLKFGYSTDDNDIRHQVLMELQNMGGLEITNSSPVNIEVNPLGVNKASGIAEVCRLLGINMEQVVAVGDSLNDLAAITQAGLGVAMGNAQQTVREEADVVVASNNEDGIAEVIEKYVLAEVETASE